jgi:drug/metabolite transporter (DMT)-like permease
MVPWEAYAGLASLALGSFGIPLHFTHDKLSPFSIVMVYGNLLAIVGFILQQSVTNKDGEYYQWNLHLVTEWFWAILSVSIQCIGVQSLLFGLMQEDVIISVFFAIVSTQTLWSTFLSLLFLGEWKNVIVWKIVLGTILIVCGVLLVSQAKDDDFDSESESSIISRTSVSNHGTFFEN